MSCSHLRGLRLGSGLRFLMLIWWMPNGERWYGDLFGLSALMRDCGLCRFFLGGRSVVDYYYVILIRLEGFSFVSFVRFMALQKSYMLVQSVTDVWGLSSCFSNAGSNAEPVNVILDPFHFFFQGKVFGILESDAMAWGILLCDGHGDGGSKWWMQEIWTFRSNLLKKAEHVEAKEMPSGRMG